MADANSKALIQALSEVIRDFNAKINEQFGENFKKLNLAVERLVQWQEQYEHQLNQLIEQETATRKTMTEASLRYAELVNKSSTFVAVATSLENIIKTSLNQSERLDAGLRSLAELVSKAATGLPQIERQIVEMTRQLEQGVRVHQDTLGSVMKSTALAIETANKELNTHVRQASEDVKKQVVALDKVLEQELTRSIESLGRQLTALSRKFVDDYTPLTQRLQQLLQAARA
jgi:ABC-type transporter Mla subunit MlaD